MRERFHARDPRSLMLRFHTQTAGSTLTAQQPEVNVVRTTVQALAAVLGGTQSLHTNAMDEALSLPTEQAARLALRTQQVVAHESGVADTVDPLAGSYAVRHLRQRRDNERFEVALTMLEDAARGTENLLPRILDCAEALATVGEISRRLRHVWGEYREAVTV